ncbi:DUF6461 domain-containing protein [Sphaerisporangium corydalis]|uniref:DUF6461 domain-containing protein n=1 Tax=Sphaerisporangium corydalis TaxID=1441875 RepID=A0ABV9EPX0_9ACTN|nr:DUF6461 domain-containing protein [Sphaerisporangium corydalis]
MPDDHQPPPSFMTHSLCLTWCDGLDSEEALLRIGGLPQTISRRSLPETVTAAHDALPQYSGSALTGKLGQWNLIVEPNGFQGSRLPVLADLSSDGQAMSVFWNVNGDAQIAYAERGRIIAVIDPFDPEEGDDDEAFLLRWESVAELDEDWRVGALRLAETVMGQHLGADWFSEPRLSAIIQALPDPPDSETDDERDAYLREQRALLAEDPQLAALVEDPAREKLRAMAAYVAELVGDRAGLSRPLVEEALAALRAQGEVAQQVKTRLEDVERDLLAEAAAVHDSGPVEPGSPAHRLVVESRAVRVMIAALNESPATALWEALWYAEMLRLDGPDRIRLTVLRAGYDEIERRGEGQG